MSVSAVAEVIYLYLVFVYFFKSRTFYFYFTLLNHQSILFVINENEAAPLMSESAANFLFLTTRSTTTKLAAFAFL